MKNLNNILAFAALIVLSQPCSVTAARATHVWPDAEARLQLHLTEHKGAFILYDGAIVMPSFFGRIEHYQRDLSLKRKRLSSGPWRGLLTGKLNKLEDKFTLSGHHDKSDFYAEIRFINRSTIELKIRFKSDVALAGLSIEIFKLSSTLYKNTPVDATPAEADDIHRLPLEPRHVKNRFLLRNKNSIYIKSAVCDIQVTDVREARTLNVADFRSVPWDPHKSFYFNTDENLVALGDWVELAYHIQFFPPSIDFKDRLTHQEIGAPKSKSPTAFVTTDDPEALVFNPSTFFSITPRFRQSAQGHFRLNGKQTIYSEFARIARQLADDLQAYYHLNTDIRPIKGEKPPRGIYIELLSREEADRIGLPAEGFQIEVTANLATISGIDERGCLFGAYAFLGLIEDEGNHKIIPGGVYRDWPDLPIRAVCLELLPSIFIDTDLFKSYLKAFSRARTNTVIFHHSLQQLQAWNSLKGQSRQWSPESLSAVADFARTLKMDVWAGLIHKLDPRDFPNIALPGTNFYDPTKEASYDFLNSQYCTLVELYHPEAFLIGHDEIVGLSKYAKLYKKSETELLAGGVNKIHRWLQTQNIKTLMWGDMLLDQQRWQDKIGDANSGNPFYKSGDTANALLKIDRSVAIIDWHYKNKSDYPSIGYFHDLGFDVLGCSWYDPAAAKSMAASAKKYGGKGVVVADWGFWRTLSPSSTTLYSPLSGWHTDIEIDGSNDDVKALAGSMRRSLRLEGSSQSPISLSAFFNASTWDKKAGDGSGLFDIGPIVDLRLLPAGTHTMAGIEYLLPTSAEGRDNNCIVISEAKTSIININPKVRSGLRAIGFVQTCYSRQPQYRSRRLGAYNFTYTDGTVVNADIIEGWNITDIRSTMGLRANDWSFDRMPDELIGAYPAWRGRSAVDIPLNMQMWLWTNPYPEKTLKTITVQTADIGENVKIAVLAATAIYK